MVWARDGGRCAFVADDGRRCEALDFLEFHHVVPYARGGPSTADNLELRCRAHNSYEAARQWGRLKRDAVRELPEGHPPGTHSPGCEAEAVRAQAPNSPRGEFESDGHMVQQPASFPKAPHLPYPRSTGPPGTARSGNSGAARDVVS